MAGEQEQNRDEDDEDCKVRELFHKCRKSLAKHGEVCHACFVLNLGGCKDHAKKADGCGNDSTDLLSTRLLFLKKKRDEHEESREGDGGSRAIFHEVAGEKAENDEKDAQRAFFNHISEEIMHGKRIKKKKRRCRGPKIIARAVQPKIHLPEGRLKKPKRKKGKEGETQTMSLS